MSPTFSDCSETRLHVLQAGLVVMLPRIFDLELRILHTAPSQVLGVQSLPPLIPQAQVLFSRGMRPRALCVPGKH